MDVTVIVPVVAVLVLSMGGAIGLVVVLGAKKKGRMVDAWARAAYSLWTGGEDSATWSSDRAQKSFRDWYGAQSSAQAQSTIEELVRGQTGNLAWDAVRALDLVRIALAAGYIDQDQAKTYEARIGKSLQSAHRGWEDLARAFEAGMRAWHQRMGQNDPRETDRVQRNLPVLRSQIWPSVPFGAELVAPD